MSARSQRSATGRQPALPLGWLYLQTATMSLINCTGNLVIHHRRWSTLTLICMTLWCQHPILLYTFTEAKSFPFLTLGHNFCNLVASKIQSSFWNPIYYNGVLNVWMTLCNKKRRKERTCRSNYWTGRVATLPVDSRRIVPRSVKLIKGGRKRKGEMNVVHPGGLLLWNDLHLWSETRLFLALDVGVSTRPSLASLISFAWFKSWLCVLLKVDPSA